MHAEKAGRLFQLSRQAGGTPTTRHQTTIADLLARKEAKACREGGGGDFRSAGHSRRLPVTP